MKSRDMMHDVKFEELLHEPPLLTVMMEARNKEKSRKYPTRQVCIVVCNGSDQVR